MLANTCVITLLRISASMEMHSCQFWAHFYKPANVFKKMPSTHTWYLQVNVNQILGCFPQKSMKRTTGAGRIIPDIENA
mgnify:CR=1 FL=1